MESTSLLLSDRSFTQTLPRVRTYERKARHRIDLPLTCIDCRSSLALPRSAQRSMYSNLERSLKGRRGLIETTTLLRHIPSTDRLQLQVSLESLECGRSVNHGFEANRKQSSGSSWSKPLLFPFFLSNMEHSEDLLLSSQSSEVPGGQASPPICFTC